jgi:hypothetical protein
MDLLTALVLLAIGAAIVKVVFSPATERGIDAFAAGFLPYKGPGWPQGVQEEEPVAWTWSHGGRAATSGNGQDGPLDAPEVVDIDGDAAPTTITVRRGPTGPGPASRGR